MTLLYARKSDSCLIIHFPPEFLLTFFHGLVEKDHGLQSDVTDTLKFSKIIIIIYTTQAFSDECLRAGDPSVRRLYVRTYAVWHLEVTRRHFN